MASHGSDKRIDDFAKLSSKLPVQPNSSHQNKSRIAPTDSLSYEAPFESNHSNIDAIVSLPFTGTKPDLLSLSCKPPSPPIISSNTKNSFTTSDRVTHEKEGSVPNHRQDIAWLLSSLRPESDKSDMNSAYKEIRRLVKQGSDEFWSMNCAQVGESNPVINCNH